VASATPWLRPFPRRPQQRLADALYHRIPAGVGSTGHLHLTPREMDAAGLARRVAKLVPMICVKG